MSLYLEPRLRRVVHNVLVLMSPYCTLNVSSFLPAEASPRLSATTNSTSWTKHASQHYRSAENIPMKAGRYQCLTPQNQDRREKGGAYLILGRRNSHRGSANCMQFSLRCPRFVRADSAPPRTMPTTPRIAMNNQSAEHATSQYRRADSSVSRM